MDSLEKAKNTQEMLEEIKKLEVKIEQYQRQINKNREVLKNMLTEAETTTNDERKQELIQRIEGSIEYNKKFIKAMEKAAEQAKLSKESLDQARALYNAPVAPTFKPKSTAKAKKGGKRKKTRKRKKTKKTRKHKK
tara:strand:+ start:1690 stop:2097 length:408 start_codon:yes stop_codon:yes gene_type:complete